MDPYFKVSYVELSTLVTTSRPLRFGYIYISKRIIYKIDYLLSPAHGSLNVSDILANISNNICRMRSDCGKNCESGNYHIALLDQKHGLIWSRSPMGLETAQFYTSRRGIFDYKTRDRARVTKFLILEQHEQLLRYPLQENSRGNTYKGQCTSYK